jgi:hypothetical protein
MKKYFLIIGLAVGLMFFSHAAAYAASATVTAELQNGDLSAGGCAFFQVSAISRASASGNNISLGNTINGNNPENSSWNPSSCLRAGLNDSVFTTDFRIAGQMADVGCGSVCWGAPQWTNWASDIAAGANPIGDMVGSSDRSHWVQMRLLVQTRPLDPSKEIVANLGVTLFELDDNAPIGTPIDPAGWGTRPFVFTPNGGGWTVFNTACGHVGSTPRCSGVGGTSNSPNEFEFRLNAVEQAVIGPPSNGTINVSSVNSQTGGSIQSSWAIEGPSGDICGASNCSNVQSGSYSAPAGAVYNLIPTGTPSGYSFRSSEIIPIATRQGFWGNLLSLTKNLMIPSARAWTISPASSQSLPSAGSSITFTIKWDPEAAILLNPTSLSGSGSFTIKNNGTPGSKLDWTASSNNGCATISTPSGNNVDQGSSNTENVTVSGACSAKITVSGISQPSGNAVPSKIVTISASGPVGPSVDLTAAPGTINLYGSTTLTWTVTNADSCTASASPAENNWNGSKSATGGSQSASPLALGNETYTLTCTGPGGSQSDTATVKVNPGPLPKCSISANPLNIVVPQTSTIAYNCTNIQPQDVCSLTGSDGNNYPVSRTSTIANGTQPVGPTKNTSYTISCQDPNNAGVSASATVSVNVTNPNQGECPPQGCTTP